MSDTRPTWLAAALRRPAGDGSLAVAQLGGVDLLDAGGFRLMSAAFADGGELDPSFTAEEEDAVAPPLEWTAPPPGSAELVLVVERLGEGGEPFCHWLVWGIAPQQGKLLEGETPPRVGKNSFGNSEWALPAAPAGEEPDRFVFQLFALDAPVALMPGARRGDLVGAMAGHVIGCAVLGATFAGVEDDDESWDDDED